MMNRAIKTGFCKGFGEFCIYTKSSFNSRRLHHFEPLFISGFRFYPLLPHLISEEFFHKVAGSQAHPDQRVRAIGLGQGRIEKESIR
jgi:hypothetical protein